MSPLTGLLLTVALSLFLEFISPAFIKVVSSFDVIVCSAKNLTSLFCWSKLLLRMFSLSFAYITSKGSSYDIKETQFLIRFIRFFSFCLIFHSWIFCNLFCLSFSFSTYWLQASISFSVRICFSSLHKASLISGSSRFSSLMRSTTTSSLVSLTRSKSMIMSSQVPISKKASFQTSMLICIGIVLF